MLSLVMCQRLTHFSQDLLFGAGASQVDQLLRFPCPDLWEASWQQCCVACLLNTQHSPPPPSTASMQPAVTHAPREPLLCSCLADHTCTDTSWGLGHVLSAHTKLSWPHNRFVTAAHELQDETYSRYHNCVSQSRNSHSKLPCCPSEKSLSPSYNTVYHARIPCTVCCQAWL